MTWVKLGYEIDPPDAMKAVYKALRQDGALNSTVEKTLERLNRVHRNAMTHRYPEVSAADIRDAILDFTAVQPPLRQKLAAWLEKHGYGLP